MLGQHLVADDVDEIADDRSVDVLSLADDLLRLFERSPAASPMRRLADAAVRKFLRDAFGADLVELVDGDQARPTVQFCRHAGGVENVASRPPMIEPDR